MHTTSTTNSSNPMTVLSRSEEVGALNSGYILALT